MFSASLMTLDSRTIEIDRTMLRAENPKNSTWIRSTKMMSMIMVKVQMKRRRNKARLKSSRHLPDQPGSPQPERISPQPRLRSRENKLRERQRRTERSSKDASKKRSRDSRTSKKDERLS